MGVASGIEFQREYMKGIAAATDGRFLGSSFPILNDLLDIILIETRPEILVCCNKSR